MIPVNRLVQQSKVESDPKSTANDIARLITQLFGLYKNEFKYPEFPVELMQFAHMTEIFTKILEDIKNEPLKNLKIQEEFLKKWTSLQVVTLNKLLGLKSSHLDEHYKVPAGDKRFSDPLWKESVYFEFLKRSYYLISKYTLLWFNSISTLDLKTRQQLHLYVKNFLNLVAPTNYLMTNPELIQAIMETKGENLLNGLKNYLEDLVLNNGHLNIRMTDLLAYTVGENLATTPGKVIYQNDLMQLIQYNPTTSEVYTIPILFIPPWINKYYILDLSPENSLVKWLLDQGFTVYMISWVNPGPELAHKQFEDYMLEGPLQALDIITKTAKCSSVHMVGYCIGGTLLACTLAYMKKTKDNRAASATYFMTLLNFSNPGELGVFIDKLQLDNLEKLMEQVGYLDGRLLNMTFNLLRPNDLIWPYVIHNYLLGKPSKPFDILYWNSDPTNLPYKMYLYYLRQFYLKNHLKNPGEIKLKGIPISLEEITTPSFFLASETDHITLWRAVYSGTRLQSGPVQFVLSDSGHVRAVVNPPSTSKYSFKTNEDFNSKETLPKQPKEWLATATTHSGSWWPYWLNWLTDINAEKVPARHPEQNGLPILEDAPGSYVLKKI